MTEFTNDIPLLEYDPDPTAVIMPEHEGLDLKLPRKAVFAFLYEEVDIYAKKHNAKVVSEFISATKSYPVYVLETNGQEICLMQAPVGAPAAVQILDWLIAYGVREVISGGSCGVLTEMAENSFLIPVKALRDEGTSYHYLPPSRFVDIPETGRRAIEKTLKARNLPYTEVTTWTTDGFFRETKAKVERRKAEGCSVVEMECASLAACAQLRGIVFGQLLYTADTLADAENYNERSWGADSLALAMELCIESVLNL